MKKILSVLLVLCSMFTLLGVTSYAAEGDGAQTLTMQMDNPMMTVDGEQQEIDPGRGTTPAIVENRTLVPIRAIVEALGGTVAWDQSTRTATLTYGEDEIRLTLNSTTAYLNGEAHTLDVAPTTMNNRTMLPIRFIAEGFQFGVDWNQAERTITITKNAETTVPDGEPTKPAEESTEPTEAAQSRAVVVYFSATGATETLAEQIAAVAGADLAEIVPEAPYTSEDLNYNNDDSRANQEISSNAHPAIEALSVDLAEYDVILLGYPIWWGQCPPVIETFLESNDLAGKTIMPFCTSGSSGISGSLSDIRTLCSDSTVTDGFRGTSATTVAAIQTWLENDGYILPEAA